MIRLRTALVGAAVTAALASACGSGDAAQPTTTAQPATAEGTTAQATTAATATPPPTTTAAPQPAATTAAAQPAGTPQHVVLTNRQWVCRSPQHDTQVDVTITTANVDAVHLDAGCTGTIRVDIHTSQRDGIKIHNGAHDLEVWGKITCDTKSGLVHQDGVQAMGGRDVTLKYLGVRCPTGNNGGLFVSQGKGMQSMPTNIICDHCDLFEGNAALHVGVSAGSGARDSILWHGIGRSAPKTCRRIEKFATDPVDSGNTCQGQGTADSVAALPPAPAAKR